jgi:hypothetical protein
VSLSTPASMKKCRPLGNDIAVAISLQQASNGFPGSDNRLPAYFNIGALTGYAGDTGAGAAPK